MSHKCIRELHVFASWFLLVFRINQKKKKKRSFAHLLFFSFFFIHEGKFLLIKLFLFYLWFLLNKKSSNLLLKKNYSFTTRFICIKIINKEKPHVKHQFIIYFLWIFFLFFFSRSTQNRQGSRKRESLRLKARGNCVWMKIHIKKKKDNTPSLDAGYIDYGRASRKLTERSFFMRNRHEMFSYCTLYVRLCRMLFGLRVLKA